MRFELLGFFRALKCSGNLCVYIVGIFVFAWHHHILCGLKKFRHQKIVGIFPSDSMEKSISSFFFEYKSLVLVPCGNLLFCSTRRR